MKSATTLLILLLTMLTGATAQNTQKAEGLKALDFLIGTWSGEGWIRGEKGQVSLVSTELVQSKLDDNALLVEGIHRNGASSEGEGDVLFEALALITYNGETGAFDWRSATSEGRGGNFKAELVGEKSLRWGREGSFRYIIKIDENGRWHETGESTRDGGKTWHQFFEMTLEKQQ